MFNSLFCFSLVITLTVTSPSPRVLIFMGTGSLSHRTALEPLAHKLVENNFHVTFLTAIPPTVPNPKFVQFTPLGLKKFYEQISSIDEYVPGRFQDKYYRPMPTPEILDELELPSCSIIFEDPEFKPWLEQNKHFDIVMVEHSCNKCGYALAHYFKAPVILFSANIFHSHEEDIFGLPIETSWLPNFALANTYTKERTFYDKLYGTWYRLYSLFYTNYIALPKIDKLVQKVLNLPNMPSIVELEQQLTSLIFINQHFSGDYARSLPPLVVPVGGMHCREPLANETLPKEISNFIDGAGEEGFVFVSFGTIIHMSRMPPEFVSKLLKDVEGLKTRFLWKWDTQPPDNLPKNVMAAQWFPQQLLLAHPKIKAFVTHGGMMSTQQAEYFGVPTIVVPVLFDQAYNAQVMEHHGMGIHLELSEMQEKFGGTIKEILENEKYTINAKLVSQRFRDRPMSPIDTAFWWTNWLLRNKNDTSHVKPLGMHQFWWERRLLDVWLFIFVVSLIVLIILVKLIGVVFKLCFFKSSHSQQSKTNDKLKRN